MTLPAEPGAAAPPIPPHHSRLPEGGDGFGLSLRAEWTKFRSVRGSVIALVVAALITLALSLLAASGSNTTVCNPGPGGQGEVCGGAPPLAKGPGGEAVSYIYTFDGQSLAGDATVTVHVASLSGAEASSNSVGVAPDGTVQSGLNPALSPWAKAGILVTATTNAGSAYGAVMVTGGHGVRMQYDYTHDRPATDASARWLRLVRRGDTLTGYQSVDGAAWTEIATAQVALPATVQIGLFVTSPVAVSGSQTRPSLATAAFDNLSVQGGLTPSAWAGQVIGDQASYPTLPLGPTNPVTSAGGSTTVIGSGDIAPAVGGGILGGFGVENTLDGGFAGIIVFLVVATLFITAEYRRGMIRTTFAATPSRGRVLAAKAVVVATVTFVVTVPVLAVALILGRHQLQAHGNRVFPIGGLTEVRVVVGTAIVFALAAVLALALGTILRRSAGAVVGGIVLLIVPFIVAAAVPVGASQWLMRLTPAAGFAIQQTLPRYSQVAAVYSPSIGYYPLSPWVGLAVLAAFAGCALLAAGALLRRRDA